MPPLLQILFYILLIQRVLLMSIRYFRIKYFCQSVCDTTPIACGDGRITTKGKVVKNLDFIHLSRGFKFTGRANLERKIRMACSIPHIINN